MNANSYLEKLSNIKLNPNNPRLIKDDKFKKLVQSIKDFINFVKKQIESYV